MQLSVGVDTSQIINLAAVVTALAAVLASSLLSMRAIRLAQHANHVPIIVNLLAPHRSGEFVSKETELWNELPKQDSACGFMKLPDPIRSHAFDIGLYYHVLGYLSEYGLADREFLIVQTHYRMLRTWKAIEPFVKGERQLRGGPNTFMNSYERFVADAESLDIAAATQRLLKRGINSLN